MSPRPLFLERSSYRRRRLGDAARILPALALVLLLLPVWWFPDRVSLTGGALWLFGLWAALIGLIAALHLALGRADRAARRSQALGRDAEALGQPGSRIEDWPATWDERQDAPEGEDRDAR